MAVIELSILIRAPRERVFDLAPSIIHNSTFILFSSVSISIYILLAVFVSPFTGAALRHWQPCCLHFSEGVALCLFPFLALGCAVRFMPWFAKHSTLRAFVSWGGLGLWCLGAPVSCLHALS